jgi:hypothetical protein
MEAVRRNSAEVSLKATIRILFVLLAGLCAVTGYPKARRSIRMGSTGSRSLSSNPVCITHRLEGRIPMQRAGSSLPARTTRRCVCGPPRTASCSAPSGFQRVRATWGRSTPSHIAGREYHCGWRLDGPARQSSYLLVRARRRPGARAHCWAARRNFAPGILAGRQQTRGGVGRSQRCPPPQRADVAADCVERKVWERELLARL